MNGYRVEKCYLKIMNQEKGVLGQTNTKKDEKRRQRKNLFFDKKVEGEVEKKMEVEKKVDMVKQKEEMEKSIEVVEVGEVVEKVAAPPSFGSFGTSAAFGAKVDEPPTKRAAFFELPKDADKKEEVPKVSIPAFAFGGLPTFSPAVSSSSADKLEKKEEIKPSLPSFSFGTAATSTNSSDKVE